MLINNGIKILQKCKSENGFDYFQGKGLDVAISQEVLSILQTFLLSENRTNEAGGVLLGFRYKEGIEINRCTSPFSQDIRMPYNFHRKDKLHLLKADEYWKSSNSYSDYIGEWHTHPYGDASPSYLDKREWLKSQRSFQKQLVMIIASPDAVKLYSIGHN